MQDDKTMTVPAEAAEAPEARETLERRAALARLAKWAAVAPTLAVLVDPKASKAELFYE